MPRKSPPCAAGDQAVERLAEEDPEAAGSNDRAVERPAEAAAGQVVEDRDVAAGQVVADQDVAVRAPAALQRKPSEFVVVLRPTRCKFRKVLRSHVADYAPTRRPQPDAA